MASKYMDDYRENCRREKDNKVAEIRRRAETEKEGMVNQSRYISDRKNFDKVGFFLVGGLILGGILSTFLTAIMWFVGAFLGVGACYMYNSGFNKNQQAKRNELLAKGDRVMADAETEIARLEAECESRIEAEKQKYLTRVKAARMSYSHSQAMGHMVAFVADRLEKAIRSADRAPYQKEITADLCYRLTAVGLHILSRFDPKKPDQNVLEKIPYQKFYIYNVDDFFDQIGLAQALAKMTEFEIIKRFPYDPVLPSKLNKTQVKIASNDTQILLRYHVYNPHYKAAVNPKYH